MHKRQLIVVGIVLVAVTIIFATVTFRQQAQDKSQSKGDDAPVLDYETEIKKMVSKEQTEKNKHFNSRNVFPPSMPEKYKKINELPTGVENLPVITHWWRGLPALPVEQSTAVVLGEITDTEAHLSDDRAEIYSEFILRIEEVFKDKNNLVRLNNSLSVTREGGNVRFSSGRVQKYRIYRQGMPQKGRHYILFLKQQENGDFLIVTGYEISNSKITPLDGEDEKDPRSNLSFAKYRGIEESRLLQDLRKALQNGGKSDL